MRRKRKRMRRRRKRRKSDVVELGLPRYDSHWRRCQLEGGWGRAKHRCGVVTLTSRVSVATYGRKGEKEQKTRGFEGQKGASSRVVVSTCQVSSRLQL